MIVLKRTASFIADLACVEILKFEEMGLI